MCSAAGIVLFFEQNEPSKEGCSNLFKASSVAGPTKEAWLAKIGSVSVSEFFVSYIVPSPISHSNFYHSCHLSQKKTPAFKLLFLRPTSAAGFSGNGGHSPPSGRLQPLTVSAFWPFRGGGATAKVAKTVEPLIVVGNDTVESGILKNHMLSQAIWSYHIILQIWYTVLPHQIQKISCRSQKTQMIIHL